MICREALHAADEIIDDLKKKGHDYSSKRIEIATAYDEEMLHGSDTMTVDCGKLKDLLIIQEDHYDQHMDEDEDKPEWGEMICYVGTLPSYVWFA